MTADTPPPHRPGARTTGAYARARSARAEDACPHGVRVFRAGADPGATGPSVRPLPCGTGSHSPHGPYSPYSPHGSSAHTPTGAHSLLGAPVDPARARRIRLRSERPLRVPHARRIPSFRTPLPDGPRSPRTSGVRRRGARQAAYPRVRGGGRLTRSTPRMTAHGAGTPPEPPVQGRSAKVGSVFGARRGNVVFRPYRGDLPAAFHPPPHPHSGAAP